MEQLAKDLVAAVFDAAGSALSGLWGLLPWEVQLAGGVVALVVLLLVVKLLRDLGGWPLVGAFLIGIVGFVCGVFGFHRGVRWAEARKPVVAPKKHKTLFGRK